MPSPAIPRRLATVLLAAGTLLAPAYAQQVNVPLRLATEQGAGEDVGSIRVEQTRYGLAFTPELRGLTPGLHGFHVHENPSCEPARKDGKPTPAAAAGDHYDPKRSGKHGLPWGTGHLGDLPPLYVAADGTATQPVLAPRLKLADVTGRSLMVHAGGDNHADHPQPLGGGGGRIACGVIEKR